MPAFSALLSSRAGRAGHFEIETALVPWIVGAVAGAAIVGVVGRRARADEREAVGVVVRVEEVRELVRRLGDAQRPRDAEHDKAVEAGRQRNGRHRNAQRHARRFRLVEVGHPLHAGVDREPLATFNRGLGRIVWLGRARIGADRERSSDVFARDRHRHPSTRMHDRDPAVRQQPRLRRVTPGLITVRKREGGEHRSRCQRGSLRCGRIRPFG